MNISSVSSNAAVLESIDKMNDMLKSISATQLGLENKMMKASVVANVTGLGENIDISA